MKLLIVAVMCMVAIVAFESIVKAEVNLPDLLKDLPALNQDVIFSLEDGKFDYATSITLVSLFNSVVNIDLGYAQNVQALGLVSIKLIEFKNIIKFPILDKIVIEPFVYAGTKRIENFKELGEYDYGVGVKVISLKF